MKSHSIPRLELLSCLLLANLILSVKNAVECEIEVSKVFCWSDSEVALWWIQQKDKLWNVWVQNRVEIIREKTSSFIWFHVPTSLNPADISTRSISLYKFLDSSWFIGPPFLLESDVSWPFQKIASSCSGNLEERVVKTSVNVVHSVSLGIGNIVDCTKFSCLNKLLRVTSYVLRFIENIKKKINGKELNMEI